MLFSVIVPVYNTERYVSECLDSVLGQTFQDFELVVVNDGSTDGSPAICQRLATEHPDKVRYVSQSNRGLLATRCRGVREASGDYVVTLDSDDALRIDALERIAESLAVFRTDVVCYSYSRHADFPGCEDWVFGDLVEGPVDLELIKRTVCSTTLFNSIWGKAIKRELFQRACSGLENLRLTMAEDLLQLLGLINMEASFSVLKQPLYFYRPNEDSSTRCFKPTQLGDIDYVYGKLLDCAREWDQGGSFLSDCAAATTLYTWSINAQSIANALRGEEARRQLDTLVACSTFKKACSLYNASNSQYGLPVRAYTWLLIRKKKRTLIAVSRARTMARGMVGKRHK